MLNTLFTAFVSGLGVAFASLAVFPSTRILASDVKMNEETKILSACIALEVLLSVLSISNGTTSSDYIEIAGGLLWLVPALAMAHKIYKSALFKEATK